MLLLLRLWRATESIVVDIVALLVEGTKDAEERVETKELSLFSLFSTDGEANSDDPVVVFVGVVFPTMLLIVS